MVGLDSALVDTVCQLMQVPAVQAELSFQQAAGNPAQVADGGYTQ